MMTVRQAFEAQADYCTANHAPVTAALCRQLGNVLDTTTQTGTAALGWTGDPVTDALPLRLAGAFTRCGRRARRQNSRRYSNMVTPSILPRW
jgi:hypothetical protein